MREIEKHIPERGLHLKGTISKGGIERVEIRSWDTDITWVLPLHDMSAGDALCLASFIQDLAREAMLIEEKEDNEKGNTR